jgi:glutamate-1-semialdehyde 2,1-aminomutase
MRDLIRELLDREWSLFATSHPGSEKAHKAALSNIPLGVASSFQHYDPFPIHIERADGAWAWDVDNRRYLDLNMGFGALLVGHRHPHVMAAIKRQLDVGTLFVAPSAATEAVAAELASRFNLEQWRFTNSGTEALQTAVRIARASTNRDKIVKVEGGYHGHSDALLVSAKPDVNNDDPVSSISDSRGVPSSVTADTLVVEFNDPDALEALFQKNAVAAFVVEPVMENIGIVLPVTGYLETVRQLCWQYGVLLVFDEVKTGLTAHWGGATRRFGVTPDIVCLAKSIGGGLPVGAIGGTAAVMSALASNTTHHGTYNANPLVLAATKATLEVCTKEALVELEARNTQMSARLHVVLRDVPHTISLLGAKGCIAWRPTAPLNYRGWKQSDKLLAELVWLWGLNRGVLTPPGLDEQWLVSLAHDTAACAFYVDVLDDLATELRR